VKRWITYISVVPRRFVGLSNLRTSR
jgi:hypothetical protein